MNKPSTPTDTQLARAWNELRRAFRDTAAVVVTPTPPQTTTLNPERMEVSSKKETSTEPGD